ncbi:MAG: hypothetical protein AAF677_16010 [Pseudomonadota bacterium]
MPLLPRQAPAVPRLGRAPHRAALATALVLAVGLAGCATGVQRTSGADYLASGPRPAPIPAARTAPNDADMAAIMAAIAPPAASADPFAAAAGVEPTLTLPARIGLARLEHGRLTRLPEAELALWRSIEPATAALGTVVPLDPLIAASAARAAAVECQRAGLSCGRDPMERLRYGAARQHLDAVLVYDVASQARRSRTAIAFADLTLIGAAVLPTRSITAEAEAGALLLDVRTGYPYATAMASAEDARLSPAFGGSAATAASGREAGVRAVEALVAEVATLIPDVVADARARTAAAASGPIAAGD